MQMRNDLLPVWGRSSHHAALFGLLLGLVCSPAGLLGCEKTAPEPTTEEILASNVASLQEDLTRFVMHVDEVEALAETRPVMKQALEPLRAQEAIAQSCIDELTRRIDTLREDMAAQTDPRTSGKPAIWAFLDANIEMWLEFNHNISTVWSFLRLARAEPGLADHEIESWVQRFEIQRKKLASLAPPTEP